MSTRIFEIPSEMMLDFSERVDELELSNQIVGKNDSDEIIVEVYYSHQQKGELLSLVDWLQNEDSFEEDDE